MLHNNGPYGPNESSGNMNSQVNMGFANSVNNLNKIVQETGQMPMAHYNLPTYGAYRPDGLSVITQSPRYPHYNLENTHQILPNPHHIKMENMPWAASSMPSNMHVPHPYGHADKIYNYTNHSLINNGPEFYHPRTPLNVPMCPKPEELEQDYSLSEPILNTNIRKTIMDQTKRKSLENTVRLIENIIVNTSNRSKEQKNEIDYANDSTNDSEQTPSSETRDSTLDTNISQGDNTEVMKSDLHAALEESSQLNETKDCNDEEELNARKCTEMLNIIENITTAIQIKVEPFSPASEDNPFLKDPSGIRKEECEDEYITAETSIKDAIETIKNGTSTPINYECPHCNLLFANPKRFLIHTKWHSLGYNKKTELAKRREMKRKETKTEKITVVKEEKPAEKICPCKDCDRVFDTKSKLKYHRHTVHSSTIKRRLPLSLIGSPFKCADCPKEFKHKHSLEKHRASHMEKIHGCNECPKKFGSTEQLKMHMKTHERVTRGHTFHCTYCGKGYYEQYTLQVHERTHRNDRPYVCDICSSRFFTNSSLKRHVRVSHGNAKPFECPECHKCFATEKIRDAHAIRVHGDPEQYHHKCTQCQSRYRTSKDLQKHMQKIHPKLKEPKSKDVDSDASSGQ